MEMIELPGYTGEEKIHIANKYLIPKQATEHGMKNGEQIEFTEEALREIIHSFTREAGVRNLEREIATDYAETGAASGGRQAGKNDGDAGNRPRIFGRAEVPHREGNR